MGPDVMHEIMEQVKQVQDLAPVGGRIPLGGAGRFSQALGQAGQVLAQGVEALGGFPSVLQ